MATDTQMDAGAGMHGQPGQTSLPSLPARLLAVFVSPGRLMEALAKNPRWIGAMLVTIALIGLGTVLIPAELFMEAQREAALERGMDAPEMTERAIRTMGIVIPLAATLFSGLMMAVFAGVYFIVFAFILGDEGRYVQYLAAVAHAWFIAALLSLALTPLKISTGDPQFTLNLASFLPFLSDGYVLNVFRALDLTQIWSTLVIAQGAHAIDRRRSFPSAVAILLVILFIVALIGARFM